MEKWVITPTALPEVLRNCSKCGSNSRFLCSGSFRMNANGRNIDVWLIYKCAQCDTTWNMEILSRIKPNQIERSLYESFARNDPALAARYAFDARILGKNKADVCYDNMTYIVEKEIIDNESNMIEIISDYDLNIRLDKLLSEQLSISRAKIKSFFEDGNVLCDDAKVTFKTKVSGAIKLTIQNREQPDENA